MINWIICFNKSFPMDLTGLVNSLRRMSPKMMLQKKMKYKINEPEHKHAKIRNNTGSHFLAVH